MKKLKNAFRRSKTEKRKKSSGTKRKLIASGALGVTLAFGVLKTDVGQSQTKKPPLVTCHGGDLGKSGPGARAKADAKANVKKGIKLKTGSGALLFVENFVPQNAYCMYHKSDSPASCKSATISPSPFDNDNPSTSNYGRTDGSSDISNYKGGPSPFKQYKYDDPATVSKSIGWNRKDHLNKSYDKHAEDCFGLTENRNKENLEHFKRDVTDLAQSADNVILGSYRFKDPAYIFVKEINGKLTAVVVNAMDYEYITTINSTPG